MRNSRLVSRSFVPLLGAACLALAGCSGMMTSFGGGPSEELRQKGVLAPAQIVELWDTGWTVNDNPVVGMKVHVTPADRPSFEARIEKTTVSRIAIPQVQPGQTVMVRFDPDNPRDIAVDTGGGEPPAPSTGNPYRDHFTRANNLGANFVRPDEKPRIYLGTADSGADTQALYENGYALIGASGVRAAPDPRLALDAGAELGAALVVVYGRFTRPAGMELDVLPLRPRPAAPDQPVASPGAGPGPLIRGLGQDEQAAAFWGKTRPAILGIVSRPLNLPEQKRLRRTDGMVVESIANGSPAAAAGIQPGDVVVAIDGRPLPDVREVPALITSLAGKRVNFDVIRGERDLTVAVQLNPALP